MINEKAVIFPNLKIREKALTISILVALTAFLPIIIHSQFITGPIVNMSLILATFLIGPFEAAFLGLMPSVLALISGLLPMALAPIIPFIMISNAILIGTYHYFGKKNFRVSIFIASSLKFLFLYGVSNFIITILLGNKVAPALVIMMGWPQLFTAVMGGILAYIILSFMRKNFDYF